jgi:hypothetical protein
MDLGLSNSSTSSVDIGTLGMDHTFNTSLPLRRMPHVQKMVVDIQQDNIVKMHDDHSNLKMKIF